MNDNFPPPKIDWTGQSSISHRQRVRLFVSVFVMSMALIGIMVLMYSLLASNTPLRGIL
ncbi:hypothetical protein CES86_5310 [Brucella lupini]|uniref:Uncharacterized protein n=1 Tax=Brucella lupini TaxID=255457 RepID=A0A256H0U0_9HYPH|nr:hypothetical protein CES86_5310 [Brucella lupini]